MARATFNDLIREVRAQVAVTDDQAWTWLLDRARVLNAEARWLLMSGTATAAGDVDGRYYDLPAETVWLEAVIVDGIPYQRSTLSQMDARWTGLTGNTVGIYALGANFELFQIHPPTSSEVEIRHVIEVTDDPNLPVPFPTDFDQALVDGAIALGVARMDERFDSAGYFDSRFGGAVERLRRRRHARVGRGATAVRVIQ